MSPTSPPSGGRGDATDAATRSGHGHRPHPAKNGAHKPGARADPHPAWLRELRSLRAEIADSLRATGVIPFLRDRVRNLQRQIATTPATSKAGLLAQADLICDLAWNDLISAVAHQVRDGIKRIA